MRKNADTPLDVASAAKIIHLLAYADAVADGTLRPDTQVPVAEWEAFYLPLDGGAHAAALDRLGIDSPGTVPGESPSPPILTPPSHWTTSSAR